ncbi:hypothetical protein PRZ48_001561 [Zasmidium cellare]|uniref:CENP-V/GFA domain-containing protein n=1 Tax=Zasmidium cellare TaxID=395010 RepID=A0ABR0F1K7_ZASCE|nr:hypothetical protein PRZ48_001561 [Zasmidium cellare]
MSTFSGDPKAFDVDTFTGDIAGSCLCGNITVTIFNKPNLFKERNGHQCFCSNCRKFSGCSGSNNIVIGKDHVRVDDPRGPIHTLPTDDADDFYVLPLGIFPRIPAPEFELFSAHKHDWQAHNEGVKRYKYMSSSGEMG